VATRSYRPSVAPLLTAFLLVTLCRCGPAPSQSEPQAVTQRIVVMAPAAAGMLEALDAIDQVVGIGDYVTEPAALTDLPRVGAYDTPNLEQLLALRADLFLTAASEAAHGAHQRLESFGITVLPLDTSTYEGVFTSLEQVGRALDLQTQAAELARTMRNQLQAIEREAAEADSRQVLFVVGRDPIFVAGPGSHVDEMIALTGGTNVAHDAPSPYLQISLEAVLERMPEVIIDTSDNRPGATRGRQPGSWNRWQFLPAVRDNRVYHIDPQLLAIPGVRLPEMTRLMGRLIHPEIFGEATDEELFSPAAAGGTE
jgi:iron complex transport system substrate-binding protein